MLRLWHGRPTSGAGLAMKLFPKEAIINRFKAAMAKTFDDFLSKTQKH